MSATRNTLAQPPRYNAATALDLHWHANRMPDSEYDSCTTIVSSTDELESKLLKAVDDGVSVIRVRRYSDPVCCSCGNPLVPSNTVGAPAVHPSGITEDQCANGDTDVQLMIRNLEDANKSWRGRYAGLDADYRGDTGQWEKQVAELKHQLAVEKAKAAALQVALDLTAVEHAEALGQSSAAVNSAVDMAVKTSEYGFDKGYWSAMKDILCHLNAWEAAGLGQPIANDDGRYDAFNDAELMIRHEIGCFFDVAHAGWGEPFPTFEEWSE